MSSLVSGRSLFAAVGRRVVLAVAIAVSVVVIGGWTGRPGGQPVTVLRGTANTVNDDGSAISFHGKRVAGPRLRIADVDGGWVVAGATWFDGRSWHDHGRPTCLAGSGALAQPVELGVVEAAARHDAPGRAVVVWLKCLRIP